MFSILTDKQQMNTKHAREIMSVFHHTYISINK